MLSRRIGPTSVSKGRPFPWVVVDTKRDPAIAKLPAETLAVNARFLPDAGVHVVRPKIDGSNKQAVEDLLRRIFERKRCGVYMDEGHLHGLSPSIRMFLVAGRSQHSPVMWCSQRASQIDPFIWSQSTYFRCFSLSGVNDHRRFYENFMFKYEEPDPYYSYYYDGNQGQAFYIKPASPLDESLARFEAVLKTRITHI